MRDFNYGGNNIFLNKKLQEAEDEAEREGWISEEDLKKELGV